MRSILLCWIPAIAHLAAVFLCTANKKLDCYFYAKSCTWNRITPCNRRGWISLSREWLSRKDPGTLVSKKLNITALRKYSLSYSSWSIVSMSKRVIIPLSLALARLCSEICSAVGFVPHYNREMSNLKWVNRTPRGWGAGSHDGQGQKKGVGCVQSQEEKNCCGNSFAVWQKCQGSYG